MKTVKQLIQVVSIARQAYILPLQTLSESHALWKPSSEDWCITEITEHLFWAEQGGILGMWKTLHAIRDGKMERTFESIHKNMSVEELVERTWQPKEKVPAVAAPRMGGTIAFWRVSLESLQSILEAFGNDLSNEELRIQAHPHPISGPMDFQQRLEFLRFHINRHASQVAELLRKLN